MPSTARQPIWSATSPEKVAPAIWPMIMMTRKRPSMICRSAIGARSPMAAIAAGMTPPAMMPPTARSTSSIQKLVAKAASVESTQRAARQAAMLRNLPTESAIGPRKGWPSA